jgi:hypothetical protein
MWYSNKMKKKSYKKKSKGTEQRTLSEELSLTGMPPDMIEQLGLKEKKDINVYRIPQEKFLQTMKDFSISDQPLAVTLFNKPKNFKQNLLDTNIETPSIILRDYIPAVLIHEATHWHDLKGEKPSLNQISTSILEYCLNDLELSAYFNEIIYFLYSKNNATYPIFRLYTMKNIENLEDFKNLNFIPGFFLWGIIKNSVEKNGFYRTIKMKKEIIEKAKEQILDSIIPHILDVYLKTNKLSVFDIDYIQDFLISILSSSMNLTPEILEKIKEKFYYYIEHPTRDWLDKLTQDEIYNFYGDRFSKDF